MVDEESLLEALESGVIAGAALDVFSREPATDHPLARHPKVVATPHIGASTTDAQTAAAVDVARQLVELLASQTVRSVLPVRFVAADAVVAHEATDPRRVERLARRIETEGLLRNPPVVARLDERWVVLDGATRTAALGSLRCPHLVVQDVEIDEVAVETWHHVVRDADPERLRATLDQLPGVTVAEVDPTQAAEAVAQFGGICTITAPDRWCLVAYPRPGVSRFDALTEVVDAYLPEAVVSRVADTDLRRLRAWYPDLAVFVEFPEFTVSQVLAAARSGRVLPAGVTRFLIPGRVLRLNVPLDWLREPTSLEEKNRRLHDLLAEKERLGEIRYYREPVYLLDE
ncbi:MAG: hypothetical protein KatS3mg011_0336 [Acidimicrobiia bacterium]|nr:MAG: hypothetical protein KatS3mg011_0336 [Acidimicrobiia bacterium]